MLWSSHENNKPDRVAHNVVKAKAGVTGGSDTQSHPWLYRKEKINKVNYGKSVNSTENSQTTFSLCLQTSEVGFKNNELVLFDRNNLRTL